MRFVCDSCRAQYMISDDKVGAKGVKVRCKKCGYVILVRRPEAAAARPPAPAPVAAPTPMPAPAPAAPPVAAAAPSESSDVTRPGIAMPPPPEGITVPAAPGFAVSGGAPALDAEQTTSPSSLRIDVLAKTAENPAAAGANGGLGGEMPFEGAPSNGANGSVFSGVQEDEIGAVFDQVLSSAPHKLQETPAINSLSPPPEDEELKLQMDGDLQSTRVVSTDALKKLAEEAEAHASAEEAKEQAKKNGVPTQDWFVAVDERQVGPLALEKVKDMWDRGEISPDSLCWRAGMADWTPLSDVKELASELAPKPAKPVVASPATSVVGSVVTVPVESTFNSGGVSRVVRTEVPMAAAAPDAGAGADSGAWKPSAASALASLVSEEMSAMSKKPKARSLLESSGEHVASSAPSAAKGPGLLDIPSASEASGVNGKGLFPEVASAPAGGIALGPMASALAQSPNAPYAGPAAYAGQVPYPTYASPAAPHGLAMGLKIALGGGGALVLVLVGLVVYLIARPAQPVVVQPPAHTEASRVDLPMPPPPAGTTAAQPPAVAAAPSTAAPAQPATTTPPAVAAAPSEPPAKPDVKPVDPVASREPREAGTSRHTRGQRTGSGREEGGETVVAPKKTESSEGGGDDFDALFGGGGKKNTEAAAEGPKKKPGYIPPPPGGGDVKEELTDADVMQVVLKSKSAIVGCKDPSISGKLVMQWTVLTSGRTSGVAVLSEDFKGSSVAKCLTSLIKSWTFPRHRTQRDPIKFPFSF